MTRSPERWREWVLHVRSPRQHGCGCRGALRVATGAFLREHRKTDGWVRGPTFTRFCPATRCRIRLADLGGSTDFLRQRSRPHTPRTAGPRAPVVIAEIHERIRRARSVNVWLTRSTSCWEVITFSSLPTSNGASFIFYLTSQWPHNADSTLIYWSLLCYLWIPQYIWDSSIIVLIISGFLIKIVRIVLILASRISSGSVAIQMDLIDVQDVEIGEQSSWPFLHSTLKKVYKRIHTCIYVVKYIRKMLHLIKNLIG